jgi:predicted nucleotidyltransferase
VRTPTLPQSHFRNPLSRVLASEGAVRVLRELARHGGERSVPALADAARLSKGAVRGLVEDDLAVAGIVERVGTGRNVLYRLRTDHPLRAALDRLFEEEEARTRRVLDGLAEGARDAAPNVLAVWVYGSVARGEDAPGSDLDVALVVPDADSELATDRFRAKLVPLLEREGVGASILGLSTADVGRLAATEDPWWLNVVADALPVLGPPPAILADRLRTASSQPATE